MKKIAVSIFTLMLLALIPIQYLTITAPNGQTVYMKRVGGGIEFKTIIKHSVHQTNVVEEYFVSADGSIELVESSFSDVGWGMAQEFSLHEDTFHNKSNNISMNELVFRASHFVNPIIEVDKNEVLNLSDLVADHERLLIKCDTINFIERILN